MCPFSGLPRNLQDWWIDEVLQTYLLHETTSEDQIFFAVLVIKLIVVLDIRDCQSSLDFLCPFKLTGIHYTKKVRHFCPQAGSQNMENTARLIWDTKRTVQENTGSITYEISWDHWTSAVMSLTPEHLFFHYLQLHYFLAGVVSVVQSGDGDLGFGIPIAGTHYDVWRNISEEHNFRSVCGTNFKIFSINPALGMRSDYCKKWTENGRGGIKANNKKQNILPQCYSKQYRQLHCVSGNMGEVQWAKPLNILTKDFDLEFHGFAANIIPSSAVSLPFQNRSKAKLSKPLVDCHETRKDWVVVVFFFAEIENCILKVRHRWTLTSRDGRYPISRRRWLTYYTCWFPLEENFAIGRASFRGVHIDGYTNINKCVGGGWGGGGGRWGMEGMGREGRRGRRRGRIQG